jgi:hypothetical protein
MENTKLDFGEIKFQFHAKKMVAIGPQLGEI